jgi:hypothetical protein
MCGFLRWGASIGTLPFIAIGGLLGVRRRKSEWQNQYLATKKKPNSRNCHHHTLTQRV